jgi:hypothetical protein
MEGIRKRGRPRRRWNNEVEEDLKIMGRINWHTVARDLNEWRMMVLKAKGNNRLYCLRRRRNE